MVLKGLMCPSAASRLVNRNKYRARGGQKSIVRPMRVAGASLDNTDVMIQVHLCTVEPPNNGHIGDEQFVHCSEVVPSFFLIELLYSSKAGGGGGGGGPRG